MERVLSNGCCRRSLKLEGKKYIYHTINALVMDDRCYSCLVNGWTTFSLFAVQWPASLSRYPTHSTDSMHTSNQCHMLREQIGNWDSHTYAVLWAWHRSDHLHIAYHRRRNWWAIRSAIPPKDFLHHAPLVAYECRIMWQVMAKQLTVRFQHLMVIAEKVRGENTTKKRWLIFSHIASIPNFTLIPSHSLYLSMQHNHIYRLK